MLENLINISRYRDVIDTANILGILFEKKFINYKYINTYIK